MSRCIPVKLSDPWTLNIQQNLPTRSYQDIPKIPISWRLASVKFLLIIIGVYCTLLETTEWGDDSPGSAVFRFFFSQFSAVHSALVLFFSAVFNRTFKSRKDYAANCQGMVKFFLPLMTLCLLGGLAFGAAINGISYVYVSAVFVIITVEIVLWRRHKNYYELKFNLRDEELVEDVKRTVEGDHRLGEAVNSELFLLNTNLEESFWNEISADAWDQSIYPEALYFQKRDDGNEYFVAWSSYSTINERIKEDFYTIDYMVERNTELRLDLMRQNQLVSQMRKRVYGGGVDCSDLNQVPPTPAAARPWYPAFAEGLFLVGDGSTSLYVKLSDYREMADHVIFVRNRMPLHDQEKVALKAALQERKRMMNELVVKMLKGEVKEEEEIELKKIEDVD